MRSALSNQEAHASTIAKLSDDLKSKESEISKLLSGKEKLESYTKKALHNVQDKVQCPLQL